MSKIIIGNVCNEAMVGNTYNFTREFKSFVALHAKRMVWFMDNEDIAVLPAIPSIKMLENMNHIMGKRLSIKNFISLNNEKNEPEPLTSKNLLNDNIINAVKSVIANKEYKIFPYYFNSSVMNFANKIGLDKNYYLSPSFMNQAGADLFNNKAIFRAIASDIVPIVPGVVCRTMEELSNCIKEMLMGYPSLILKQSLNAGGLGNIVVTREKRDFYHGVIKVIEISGENEINEVFIKELWDSLTDNYGNSQIIIEEYFPTEQTMYAEYFISENKYRNISYGSVRMGKSSLNTGKKTANWIGFNIPYNLENNLSKNFIQGCEKLANLCLMLGYRGRINFDAILTSKQQIYFTEINGRLGGCSHLDIVLKRQLGEDYLHNSKILSRNFVKISDIMKAYDFSYSLSRNYKDKAVIVLNEDANIGVIEYVLYAKTVREATELEKHYLSLITNQTI